ncbi:hypothetical protein QBC44DRAFT_401999 [Cladorrhinum sp. PSN332]|nr:hypothetical protein QBC44DRAFT_401999 [Cladorrhinum sp. PSN332]
MADNNNQQIPPAQLARTLAHMNKDHRLDLQHMLQHYNSLSASEATLPEMLDLTLTETRVRVSGTGKVHTIKLSPPLDKWEDRRVVLVGMTRAAREALGVVGEDEDDDDGKPKNGKPAVAVKEYMPPRPLDWIIFWAVLGYYIIWGFVRFGHFAEGGSAAAAWLDEYWLFPGVLKGAKGFRWLTESIFGLVVAIHVVEAAMLERTRLRRYGVERGSKVWWLWMGSCFVEGAMAFKRFDIVVERVRGGQKKRN